MKKPTQSAFFKIYRWAIFSLILNFVSMAIVVPEISKNLELFAVYSVCLSLSVYLSYSDLGFISAAQKFAAEAYKRDEKSSELAFTGLTIFILISMFIPFSIVCIFLANKPEQLLNNLSVTNVDVARKLLLIVGLLLPIQIILDRLVTFILSIRLKDFIYLRINMITNLIKIASVYFFFSQDKYMLTEYYLFTTLISITGSILTLYFIKFKLSYDFFILLINIKFQKNVFDLAGKLALSSFLLTISFIIYFQIDRILIAKFIGVEEVAFFAVGFTLLTFLKTIVNIGYSPFSHSLNHQAAAREDYGLTIQNILFFTLPSYLIVISVMTISAKYLVPFWVGSEYQYSITITELLFISIFFQWLNTPASFFYNTALKYNYQFGIAGTVPVVFIIFILVTYKSLGVDAFAWAKIFVGGVISIFAYVALRSFIDIKKIFIRPLIPLTVVLLLILSFLPDFLTIVFPVVEKNSWNLVLLLAIDLIIILTSSLFVVLSIPEKRKYFFELLG